MYTDQVDSLFEALSKKFELEHVIDLSFNCMMLNLTKTSRVYDFM